MKKHEDSSIELPITIRQMIMTVVAPIVGSFVVNFELFGTGEATINWGDGKNHQTITLSDDDTQVIGSNGVHWNVPIDCKHIYPDSSARTITITGNVTYLGCSDNQLTSLDVSKNQALELLNCYKNQLTSLDVSNNIILKALSCEDNKLTSLDVSKNHALELFTCSKNQLTSLDVSNNTIMKVLSCFKNQLTSLNVSNNTMLKVLNCHENQLTSLDVSKNTTLKVLDCSGNHLKSDALNVLFGSLHNNKIENGTELIYSYISGFRNVPIYLALDPDRKSIYVNANPGADRCDRSIATNKGWVVSAPQ